MPGSRPFQRKLPRPGWSRPKPPSTWRCKTSKSFGRRWQLREAFIASIGHELRNPMVPILLSVERLRGDGAESGDLKAAVALQRCAILGHATDAFMRRADAVAGSVAARAIPASCSSSPNLRDLSAHGARHRRTPRARYRQARRVRHERSTWRTGWCTRRPTSTALEQLLDNLLSNAFKYGAGRPVARYRLRLGGGAGPRCAEIAVIRSWPGHSRRRSRRTSSILFKRARDPGAPGLGVGLWIACCALQRALAARPRGLAAAPGCGRHVHADHFRLAPTMRRIPMRAKVHPRPRRCQAIDHAIRAHRP